MSAGASLGLGGLPVAVLAGAIRGGTPFLFVSVGECLTEKSKCRISQALIQIFSIEFAELV